jgi:tetratricopeptide (TPR) repeat protein
MILRSGSRPVPGYPDYVLDRKLGAGAFGEVWHAHGPGGVDAALKFIRLDSRARALELRSLDAVKNIRHPNLVSLFGAWQRDSWFILAMELCERTLQDRLGEALAQHPSGIPQEELLGYMSDAANGLDALNENQVQHRDVKPANLLVVSSRVKVADFGLAKVLEQTVASNSGAGTIAYTAPECFRGAITQQSDEYSLAVTYYHLRTGRLLFKGDQAQVMYGHLEMKADLSQLPRAERAVLARALSKEPDKRWPNCRAFVNELMNAHAPAKEAFTHRGIAPRGAATPRVARGIASRAHDFLVKLSETFWPAPKDAPSFWERGINWLHKKEYDKAIQDFNEAIRLDPRWLPAYRDRGNAWSYKQDYDRAIVDYDVAIRLDPDCMFAYFHRGRAWFYKQDYDRAIKDLDVAIRLDPKDALSYLGRGHAWFYKQDYDRAIQDFDSAIRLDPKDALSYLRRGHTWACRQDYDRAIQDFDSTIRHDPNCMLAYFHRGQAWLNKQNYDRAIRDFDEAIRLDPSYVRAYSDRGLAWFRKRDYDKAIKDYNEAIRLEPKCVVACYHRGLAWLNKQNYDRAIRDFDEAIRLDPNYVRAYSDRGMAWLDKQGYGRAIMDFDVVIHYDPEDADAYYYRGWAYGEQQDYDRAIADFDAVIRLDPNCMLAYYNRGLAWFHKQEYDKAIADYDEAIRLDPEGAAAYAEACRFEEAVPYQTKAVDDPLFRGPAGSVCRRRLELYKQHKPYKENT